MFNTIRRKFIAGFSIILLIIMASTTYNLYTFNRSRTHLETIQNVAIESFKHASNMKMYIVKTNQYIADVSASKNVEELKKADESAEAFRKSLLELSKTSPEYKASLDEILKEFEAFYAYGKKMVDVYVNSGHVQGNEIMEDYDKMTNSLYEKVDAIGQKTHTVMDEDLDTIQMHMDMNFNLGIVIAAVILILSILIAIILGNKITKPINKLLVIFMDISKGQGDLTARIEIETKDEIGKMANAFNIFMDSMESMVSGVKQNAIVVAHGAEMLNLGGIKNSQGITTIDNHMKKVSDDTQKISASINQITASVAEIAQASQASAADAQEISSEAESINLLAKESSTQSMETKLEMEKIEEISAQTVQIAERLGNEAGQIGKIVDTIKSITEQTNLLALNAAIEAARAGEEGKGFGVVAEEIRKLAESNNQSAKMIESIIKNIQGMIGQTIHATEEVGSNIKQGSQMVENIYLKLQSITEGVSMINDRIQSIAASTQEQSASTEELSATMEAINMSNAQITGAVQEIAAGISMQTDTITELSSTAAELNQSSEQLNKLVNRFKLKE